MNEAQELAGVNVRLTSVSDQVLLQELQRRGLLHVVGQHGAHVARDLAADDAYGGGLQGMATHYGDV